MTHDSGKKKKGGSKIITPEHNVKIVSATASLSNPSGVAHKAASDIHAPTGSAKPRRRSLRIKHVAPKRGPSKNLGIQNISDDEDDQNPNLPDAVNQEANEALEKLANVATAAHVEPDVELKQQSPPGSIVKSHASSQTEHDEDETSAHEVSFSEEVPVRKTPTSSTKKGKEKKVIAFDEDSDGELLIKKVPVPVSGVKKKDANITTQKNVGSAAKSSKISRGSHIPKSGKETKKYKKSESSTGKKRRHVSDPDSEDDVEPDVPDISTTARKQMKGKKIPQHVPDAPMDNVSFHFPYSAQRWKYVVQRRLSIERELHEDALELQEIIEVVSAAGLMKTVKDLGICFDKLVREFIVNIPADCDDASSAEYRKVFVRGRCINFSPEVINEFLGKSSVVVAQGEPNWNRVATILTRKLVRKWPKKGLLPSGKLTTKYAVLYKIGTANWMATNHMSGVTPPLAKMLYLVGTGEIIAHQQPNIVRADESQGKKPLPLKFDYRFFAGTHVPDILLSAAKETASASGTKAVGSSKEDILAELKAISKSLGDIIQACKVRKLNVDQLIKAMSDVATAAAEEESEEEEAEVVAGEEVVSESSATQSTSL
ncbi:uncharacterized protein LOC130744716 [Lotus japonicus]|uniref:uncharacterized protein LOC130744716 n=1 Tax=Lotus japonicus TaxID=34305 RepID=UPI00258B0EAA|nr:uncharacterized protein LOC130744716 [Lotus japonicus]